jgi:hypothetical protein
MARSVRDKEYAWGGLSGFEGMNGAVCQGSGVSTGWSVRDPGVCMGRSVRDQGYAWDDLPGTKGYA